MNVYPLNARNPGPMTGRGNSTYLLVSAGEAVLVDAGVGHRDHLAELARTLDSTASALQMVLVTHGHADHASGVPALAAEYPAATFAKMPGAGDAESPASAPWRAIRDNDRVPVGGDALVVVHTPGHAPDHLAFWHEASRALFVGDLVIAGGSVMIQASGGGNLAQYLRSLERAIELGPRVLYPAHGARVDDPPALLRSYIAHRLERERQVLEALERGHRTVEAIVESIYDGLDPRLVPAARETVRAHLEKLSAEGAAADRDGWRIV